MKINIYSLYDKKTNVYGRPFFSHTDGHAVRLIEDELDDNQSVVAKHPDDFILNRIGCFDDNTGTIVPSDVVAVVGVGEIQTKSKERQV